MRIMLSHITVEAGIEAWHFDVGAVKSSVIESVLVQKETVFNCLFYLTNHFPHERRDFGLQAEMLSQILMRSRRR